MARKRPTYKEKIVSDAGNEIRVYSKRQVALRNSRKADRLEELRKNHRKLMRQVAKDLQSSDTRKRAQAAAVAIANETGARIGNPTSLAERGHKGITTWSVGDVRGSGGSLRVKYTGKSGVAQDHVIRQGKTVSALKRMMNGQKGRAVNVDGQPLSASSVNAYLKPFGITAKDLRGLKANEDMKAQLKRKRNQGSSLPRPRKERDPILKKEFKSALEHVAAELGHEPATLRRQYLVPGLEDAYMKDGRVSRQMNPPRRENPVALTEHKPGLQGFKHLEKLKAYAASKHQTKESFASSNLGGTGAKRTSQIVEHIDRASNTKLNRQAIHAELSQSGDWHYLHKVTVREVDAHTHGDVEPSGHEDLTKPIVVNHKGEVIDGRHRVMLARKKGIPELPAYMPAALLYEKEMNPPRRENPVALTDHKPWGTAIPDVAAVPRWAVPNPPIAESPKDRLRRVLRGKK